MIAHVLATLAFFAQTESPPGVTVKVEPVGGLAIGEPVSWRVLVDDPGRPGAAELVESPVLDLEWALDEGPRPLDTGNFGAEWTLLPLEGGELRTPEIVLRFESGGEDLVVPSAVIDVPHALAEGEDDPRDLPGFRTVEDRGIGDPRFALAILAAGLLVPLVVLGFVLVRRRRSRSSDAPPEPVAPEEQIRALDPAADPVGSTARLVPLFRRAVEARLATNRSALTDEEWAAWIEAGSTGETSSDGHALEQRLRERSARLVSTMAAVRYGGGAPTRFAAEEAKREALEVAEAPGWTASEVSE